MALSLPGERSVAAGSHSTILGTFLTWVAQAKVTRQRRAALKTMMSMDAAQLRDLGIGRSDIADAMIVRDGRTPGMVLSAARAHNSRS